jgi:hypothetical protein
MAAAARLVRVVANLGAFLAAVQRLDGGVHVQYPRPLQGLTYAAHQRAAHPRLAGRRHCPEVCTVIDRVSHVRERWKVCACGADGGRYISPLKNYLRETYTAELKWLHATLGALLPYGQGLEILSLLLPSSDRDSHASIRNHTIEIGQAVRTSTPPNSGGHSAEPIAELGIDVGHERKSSPRSVMSQA